MARENQGLQIALIVFVMFTIIFAVTTFMFSKEYGKAKASAEEAQTKASEANAALTAAESDNMRLKQIIGHAEVTTMQVVTEQFSNDMLTFAKNLDNTAPNYRLVCQWLFDEVQRKNVALSDEKKRVQDQKDWSAALEAAKDEQIKQWRDRAEKAEAEREQQRAKYQQDQLLLTQTNSKLAADKQNIITKSQEELDKAEAKRVELEGKGKKQQELIAAYQTKIDELDPIVVDHPDGLVVYAFRDNKVSINLGRAHGLRRLTNFAVYASDMTDITTAGRKGAIEVIDVSDDSAIAQIIEEDISNPIMGGDKIFTPLWKPGEQQHFALTDGMDLDRDGRSDVDELRNLITSNGGIVDYWLNDEGQAFGEITAKTNYLVVGEQPDEGSTMERLNARKSILEQSRKFNLRKISLDELLNRMGYKRQVHVVRYDSKSNPADFRPRAPEGVPRVSSGTVSDRYRKEEPPQPVINSAY